MNIYRNGKNLSADTYIIYIESKYGNDIRNAGVNFRRFRANKEVWTRWGSIVFLWFFYIYGAFWTLGWKNVSFLEPENDRNQDFLHCWIFRKMIFFSKMMFYTFKTFIGRIDPDKKGTLRVISE